MKTYTAAVGARLNGISNIFLSGTNNVFLVKKNKRKKSEIYSHVSVDSAHLLSELISADECNDYERVEGLLCGTVKQLRDNRSKPDQLVYLTLLNLARSRPNMFNSDIVIEVRINYYHRSRYGNFISVKL